MAHIVEPRVRETTTTELQANFALDGAMRGSLAFAEIMITGDTCDYVASYGETFEEGLGTLQANGDLARTTVYRARHANGDINTSKVSFAPGVKTIIMTFAANRVAALPAVIAAGNVRFDIAQTLTAPQKAQAQANIGGFAAGTRLAFQQSTAPTGWTKDITHDDKAVRLVSGSVTSGGSSPFSTVFGKTATDGTALTQAHLPNVNFAVNIPAGQGPHEHDLSPDAASVGGTNLQGAAALGNYSGPGPTGTQQATLPAMTGTAASGGSNSLHSHPMDIRVRYVDFIIAQKD